MGVLRFESFTITAGGKKREGLRTEQQAKNFLLPWLFTPQGAVKLDENHKPLVGTVSQVFEEVDEDEPAQVEAKRVRNLRKVKTEIENFVESDKAPGTYVKKVTPGEKLRDPQKFVGVLVDGKPALEPIKK